MRGDVLALLWLIAKSVLLLAGLLLPGAALSRAWRVPPHLATCFAGSAVSLYTTVLALQLASIPIALGSLVVGLGAITLLIFVGARLASHGTVAAIPANPPLSSPATRSALGERSRRLGGWTLLYTLFWFAVLWRAWHEPLAGPDVEFRWSFLAEQMLRLGNLDFYPPRSVEDFFAYFWVESIPPGASALNAWAYACAGGAHAAWTIPAVVLQIASLHALLWSTAERIGGIRAARYACLAAAACPLLTWSFLLGQETGLTALSLLGIVFALRTWAQMRARGWAALAGVFAVLGASAREYGLVFPVLACGGLILVRADRRAWLAFAAVAGLSLVWPLRTWVLTGNPVYSLSVAGNFPVNDRFVAWIEHDARFYGALLHTSAGWRELARYFLLCAPTALIGWFALGVATARRRHQAAFALAATVIVLGLWVASVRYTNGGPFYSLRVTSPALALGVLGLGVALAAVVTAKPDFRVLVRGLLALLVLGLLPTTLALPRNPWRTPPREWPAFASRPDSPPDETVALILNAIHRAPSENAPTERVILADGPGYQRRFLPHGVRVIPLWSPQADWLFDRRLPPAESFRRWRDSNVTHIIVTKWQANLDFFNAHSRWGQRPFEVRMIGETALTAVFAIRAIE